MDQRLLSLRQDFEIVFSAVKSLVNEQNTFERMMGDAAIPEPYRETIGSWYGTWALLAIRRLVDEGRDAFSLLNLLQKLRELDGINDIHGCAFDSAAIDVDISNVKDAKRTVRGFINKLVAHRLNSVPTAMVVPSLVDMPTFEELERIVKLLADVMYAYARRFYDEAV